VLSQEIVSTPGTEFDRDGIKNKRLEETDIVIDIRILLFEMGKGGNRLGLGDIDGDSEIEIVVNDNPAHVLNAILKSEEWAYNGGFGIDMAIDDMDGDNIAEIAYIESWENAYVFEADTLTAK